MGQWVCKHYIWPGFGSNIGLCINGTVRCFGWEHLNHQTTVCLSEPWSVERDPSVQLGDDSWSHQRHFTATASHKSPNNGRKGPRVFRRWATHKRLQAVFIRLALRLGGVHPFPVFTSQLSGDEGLRVPTPLMTQNLWGATNTIIQYSIMPRMEVEQTVHPQVHTCVLATTSSHH